MRSIVLRTIDVLEKNRIRQKVPTNLLILQHIVRKIETIYAVERDAKDVEDNSDRHNCLASLF
jgi:hypothetical protein